MKKLIVYFSWIVVFTLNTYSLSYANEIKNGSKVVIVTQGVTARLCPKPDCGTNEEIIRIPKDTELIVKEIKKIKHGMMPAVKWFAVSYAGKEGWVSMYNTDKQ